MSDGQRHQQLQRQEKVREEVAMGGLEEEAVDETRERERVGEAPEVLGEGLDRVCSEGVIGRSGRGSAGVIAAGTACSFLTAALLCLMLAGRPRHTSRHKVPVSLRR